MKPNVKRIRALVNLTSTYSRLPGLKARRKRWLTIHLYLGLFAGFLLAIVGLTGGILVFYHELQDLIDPQLNVVAAPPNDADYQALDSIVAAAERVKPEDSRLQTVYYPEYARSAFRLLYFVDSPGKADDGNGFKVYVDPYTAKVKGLHLWHPKDRYWDRPLMSFIMQLHWCLLLGETGGVIVGILAVASMISVLTGLIVWWPLTGKVKQALTIKRNAGAARLNYDLHKTVGFYVSIGLLPILLSGIYFNLPDNVNTLVGQFSSFERANAWNGIPSSYQSTVFPGGKSLTPGQVEALVLNRYPTGQLWMLALPVNEEGVYKVWQRNVPELSRFVGYRDITVDRYSGEIVKIHESGTGTAGDVFLDWQWPLHSGHAFGWLGRILVLLFGLACPLLFVTGLIRWLQKSRAVKVKRNKLISADG